MNTLPHFDGAYLSFLAAREAQVRIARDTAPSMRYTPATGKLEILRTREMEAYDTKLARICDAYLAGVGCLCSTESDALRRADSMFAEAVRLSIEDLPALSFGVTSAPACPGREDA